MITINTVSASKFSYNGINYFKNFTPVVSGNKISILNTYDACISLTSAPTHFSEYVVNGQTFASVALLQDALLPIIFTKSGLFTTQWGEIGGSISAQSDLQNVLNSKADLVAGVVPASQLPSYVDDVLEFANLSSFPATGETGKIYIALDNNKVYRWSGSAYIEVAANYGVWGAITGTLSNQTDLQTALNAKANDNAVVKLTGDQNITGVKTFNTGTLYAIRVNNLTDGWGQIIYNESIGKGLQISNFSSGGALQFISEGTSTGDIIAHQGIDGLVKFKLNSTGEITAKKFIKDGGTSSQFLMADGSVSTGGSGTGSLEFNDTDKTVWNNGKGNIANNTSFGDSALKSNTIGFQNTAYGFESLQSNSTGSNNTANGFESLQSNTTGNNNTANGFQSLLNNTTGSNNIANGLNALSANTTGSNNIAIGSASGIVIANGTTPNLTGSNSIFLGTDTKPLADNQTNQIVIGHNAIGHGSNTVTLGNSSIATTILRGNVLIGRTDLANFTANTNPGFTFQGIVAAFSATNNEPLAMQRAGTDGAIIRLFKNTSQVGSISVDTTSTAFNTSSDYRLKQDLQPINGLDLVSQINVYDYEWKIDELRSYGVLAHELQEVIPQAVTGEKDGEQMQGVDYSKLVPILVQAIKELKAEIELFKGKN